MVYDHIKWDKRMLLYVGLRMFDELLLEINLLILIWGVHQSQYIYVTDYDT